MSKETPKPLSKEERAELESWLTPDAPYGLRYRFNHKSVERVLAAEQYWRGRAEAMLQALTQFVEEHIKKAEDIGFAACGCRDCKRFNAVIRKSAIAAAEQL